MPSTDRGAPRRDGGTPGPRPGSGDIPWWLGLLLHVVLAVVAGFGLVGLALAVVGAFIPALVVPLGAAVVAGFLRLERRGIRRYPTTAAAQLTAAGAVLLAVGFAVVSVRHAGQHVLIDRDPGAYIDTGRWLASHSSLTFRADVGAFRGTPGLIYSSPAIDGHGGAMHFQFAHLLGVLLAEARWLGGDSLMFALVPILGGMSIALFYVVACRFVRPLVALVATAALACNIVQLHFARDAYSEILLQLVLFGSVWLLSQPGLDRRRSFAAGVLLGATVAARVDGPLYLAAVPLVVGVALGRRLRNRADDDDDDAVDETETRRALAFGAGVTVVAALAVVDVAAWSPDYARSIGLRLGLQYGALIAAFVVIALVARRVTHARPVPPARSRIPSAVGALWALALLAAWLVRPHLQQVRGTPIPLVGLLQSADHLTSDPTRYYFENSLRWFGWYLGPPALLAGILGVGRLVHDTLRRGAMYQWVLTMAFVVTGSVYIWHANALPDQLWVMRRFVPIVLPGFVLGAALTLDWLVDRRRPWAAIGAAALAAAVIVWPISASKGVRGETTQANLLGAIHATCRAIGSHAAVVIVDGSNSFAQTTPQAIRSFCEVPVAIRGPELNAAGLEALARRLKEEGRNLELLADTPDDITAIVPDARARSVATVVDRHELEQTLTKPPRSYWTKTYTFAVAAIPAG